MKIAKKSKISFAITGVNWPVYNEYFLVEVNGKQLIQGFADSGVEKYNPLYRKGRLNLTLFREFVETSENPDDILNFVKKYGLLWKDEEIRWLGMENAVEEIVGELRLFKKVTMLYELLLKLKENPNDQEALTTLNSVVEYKKWTIRPFFTIEDKREVVFIHPVLPVDQQIKILSRPNEERTIRNKRAISSYLAYLTGKKLEKGVFPSYHGIPARDGEPQSFSVYPSLECRDLASAMWLQFYMVLQGEIRLKPCKNENCPGFVEEGRREYCDNDDRCKRAKNQRDRRRRRAQEKKRGKS